MNAQVTTLAKPQRGSAIMRTKLRSTAKATGFVARTPTKASIWVVKEEKRPIGGGRLFAHTYAALSLLGMLNTDRPAIPRTALTIVVGPRAITNHLREGNFEYAPENRIRLSVDGRDKFIKRPISVSLANDFTNLFIDGKVASSTGLTKADITSAYFA